MQTRSYGALLSCLITTVLVACGETNAPSPPPPSAPTPPSPSFAIHEWGLIAIDAHDRNRASGATSVASGPTAPPSHEFGTIGSGGKPVIYVHLDPGTDEARFDLRLGVPSAGLLERWPIGGAFDQRAGEAQAGWRGVVARRSACASQTPAPTPTSPACAAPSDHFCEAAEIPRYTGDRASCLSVGDTTSEVLFYRTDSLRTPRMPLQLLSTVDGVQVNQHPGSAIEGPVFLIRAAHADAPVHIERLDSGDFGVTRAIPDDTLAPNDVRIALTDEAVKRGLTALEAEAFVDAWAPAYFDVCRRSGPEASGVVPTVLAQAGISLLYFAPPASVDVMIPLSTSPPAREVRRVFLVRWVDGASAFRSR